MKRITFYGILLTGLFFLGSCDKNDSLLTDNQAASVNDLNTELLKAGFVETPALTEVEIEMIQYMKDEEKLARDVYYAMYDKWGSRVFSNISASEESHLAAVLQLITFYSLPDSAVGAPGEFDSESFTSLYNELVEKGSVSLIDAFEVGVLIEEMDIEDLEADMALTTNENILLVFGNLLKGSENHLRAFNNQLEKLGVSYVPKYLSQEKFDAIINSPDNDRHKGKGHHGFGPGDGDGICDSLGYGHGDGDGICDSLGYGHGHGDGDGVCDSLGYGHGHGDGDGVCDSLGYGHGDGDGDGVCDSLGDGNKYGQGHKRG